MIHHFTRATRHLIFWGLMTLALGLTLIRITLAIVDSYTDALETEIAQQLSAPVTIGHLAAGMRGFRPELVLKDVAVQHADNPEKKAIKIAEIRLSIDLLHSLRQQQLLAASWITLVGLKLTLVHQHDGQITVSGLSSDPDQAPPLWLLQTARIEVLQSVIGWQEQDDQMSLVFNDVDMVLKNTQDGQQHNLNLLASLPAEYAQKLRISMQLRGNFLEPDGLNGLIYAELKHIQLANPYTKASADGGRVTSAGGFLNKPIAHAITLSSGQGDVELWSQWQSSKLQALTGIMHLQQLQLHRSTRSPLLITSASMQFNGFQYQQHWEIAVDQIKLKSHAAQLTDARIFAQGTIDAGINNDLLGMALEQLQIHAGAIDLHQVKQLNDFFSASDPLGSPLKTLRGQLKDFRAILWPEQARFSVATDFEQVSMEANASLLGITNVDGHLQGNQQSGDIILNIRNALLDLPEVFAKPLPLNALNAHFTWQQTLHGWQFASPSVALTVPDIKVNSRLQVHIDREDFGVNIDLTSAFSGSSDIHDFAKYLPVGIMGKDAVEWLNHAFLSGKITPRGALLKGRLADFPFRQQEGVFQIALDIVDTELYYTPGWEPLQKLNAELLFNQGGMQVLAQSASARDFKFSELAMHLPSFEFSDYLTVSGAGRGDLQHILDYLQQSPLKPKLTQLREVINPKGASELNLTLQIPLIDQGVFKLNGFAQLQNVRLEILPIGLPVSQVHGKIEFNEQGLTQGAVQAQVLDNSVNSVLKADVDKLQIEVQGHLHIIDLQEHLKLPLWHIAQGETAYQLTLNLPNAINQHAQMHVHSDLTGLAVTVPAPLAKTTKQVHALDIHLHFNESNNIPITVDYAQQLQAALTVDLKHKQLRACQVLVGEGQLEPLLAQGHTLNINVKELSLSDWLAFDDQDDTSSGQPFFDQVQIRAGHLLWQQQDTGSLNLTMQQKQQSWYIDIDSALLKGHIRKPFNMTEHLPVTFNLDYLNLSGFSTLQNSKPEKISAHAKRLPLIAINSAKVLWNKRDLGQLTLATRRIDQGIEFNQVMLTHPHGLLEMTGRWRTDTIRQSTEATGKFTMHNFGDFIKQLDMTDDLKDTRATIDFALNWAGAPQSFGLEKLDGQVDVDLRNGRILSIEPGFGRVLGFLAMEQWGRRLRLDFSDMIAQGLTFNSITGRFDLHQGNAVTNRLNIDAIPAMISISGVSYLPEQRLNHHVTVLPKSSAAVPIAGTIVDEVLTFAAETVTGTSQEGFLLGSEYQLLGTWQNPEVTQLHDNDGLLPKTWSGLTDFSWFSKTP